MTAIFGTFGSDPDLIALFAPEVFALAGNDSLSTFFLGLTSNLQTFGTLVGGTGNDTYNVSRNTIALIYETGGDSGDRLKFSEPLFSNTLAQTTGFAEIDGRHLFIVRNNDFGGDQTIAQIADWRVPGNRIEVFEDSTGAIYSFDDFARRLTSSPNYLGSLSYEQLLSVSGSNFSPADIQQSRNDIDATLVRSRQLDIAPTFYLRNQATGSNVAWFTDYGRILQGTPLEIPTLPTHWQLEATGDLNQDGKDDLIWWNRNTGEAAVWFMDRSRFLGATGIVSPDVNSGWRIQGAGDLNGDRKDDLVWRNSLTGENAVWYMDGTTLAGAAAIPTLGLDWRIDAVGNLDGDGRDELIWRNYANGRNVRWVMNGGEIVSGADIATPLPNPNWEIRGAIDINYDGLDDLVWVNTASSESVAWLMQGSTLIASQPLSPLPSASWSLTV